MVVVGPRPREPPPDAPVRHSDFKGDVRRYLSYVEAVLDDEGRVREADVRSFCGPVCPRAPMLTDAREAASG